MRAIDAELLEEKLSMLLDKIPPNMYGSLAHFTRELIERVKIQPCFNVPDVSLPNAPLTLDELREMDGEPVWVCEPNGANGVWGLVDLEYQMIRLHGGGLAIWENNDKSWLAYRRKPEGK